MIENLEFEEFYKAIRSEINDDSNEALKEGYRIDRFTEYFINQLGEFGITADANICFVEKELGNARAISNAWDIDEEEGRLSLFITDFRDSETPETITKQDVVVAVNRAARIYKYAEKKGYENLEVSSGEYIMIRTIKEAFQLITQVHIYYLTDGQLAHTNDIQTSLNDLPVYVSYWDIQRLYRLVSSGREYEPIEIDLEQKFGKGITCLSMPSNTDEYQGYLAIIPGDMLASLYDEYGSRLMELNVRSFLQQRGKVNKGIRETILKTPHRFLAYNNGISATAEEIMTERTANGDMVIKKLIGLQIVNGGQTVASIHRAKKIERCGHLATLAVQAKITVVKACMLEELVPKISRFSNTQNTVNEADFASNDPFHIAIEQLANTTWAPGEQTRWFYERARGQYEVARNRISGNSAAKRRTFDAQTPKTQKFAKVELAKFYNCWEQKPEIVARGSQKNFVHFMTHIAKDRPGFKPDEYFYKQLIAKAIIYKAAEKVARKHKFSSYRANAVAYTISLISFKTVGRLNLTSIWEFQDISDALSNTLNDWMPVVRDAIVTTAGSRNVTEWAKKSECWQEIQLLDLVIPKALEDEFRKGDALPTVGGRARSGRTDQLSSLDRQNINRVIQQDAELLFKLGMWGKNTGNLKDIQISIVLTAATYAAAGWESIPSHKQAKHVVAAIEIAKQAGFFDRE
ncbi:AIPR family protein [Pseudidiomarina terrestris]|uniref:AIPR family protein n=1 Tax=Pseudidiomarina terrestris TaxID=2820060 RepID=UPI0026561FC1|nr:AIPR family protein [Pseudidiomarina sp. 1ASP75-5]MDN7135987.1 AIPR family protein [Pseudidiomarina sp. 1ASP75-5]